MRISFRHPRRHDGYSPIKFCGDPNKRKDIWMIEFGPGMHFFKENLSKDQSESSYVNCAYLDSFLSWIAPSDLYSNLGSQ